jgi:hypothetical protein
VALGNVEIQVHQTSDVTIKAKTAISGKRFVAIEGRTGGGPGGLSTDLENCYEANHCGAGKKAAGISKYDIADEDTGGMIGTPGRIVMVNAAADITAGAEVMSDANGRAIAWVFAASMANVPCGLALETVDVTVAGDADVEVKLY